MIASQDGTSYSSYDKLVIATGSKPTTVLAGQDKTLEAVHGMIPQTRFGTTWKPGVRLIIKSVKELL